MVLSGKPCGKQSAGGVRNGHDGVAVQGVCKTAHPLHRTRGGTEERGRFAGRTETVKGGQIFVDSSLISRKVERDDVDTYYIPATKLASDNELTGLANMIMIGHMIAKTGVMPFENVERTMKKLVPAKKQHLLEPNLKAVKLGYDY